MKFVAAKRCTYRLEDPVDSLAYRPSGRLKARYVRCNVRYFFGGRRPRRGLRNIGIVRVPAQLHQRAILSPNQNSRFKKRVVLAFSVHSYTVQMLQPAGNLSHNPLRDIAENQVVAGRCR